MKKCVVLIRNIGVVATFRLRKKGGVMKRIFVILLMLAPLRVWSNKMIVWGGWNGSIYFNTGGIYDPVANSWTAPTTTGAPLVRAYHPAVWTSPSTSVELVDFSAVGRDGFIELAWRTEAEIDNMKWLIIRAEDRGQKPEFRYPILLVG